MNFVTRKLLIGALFIFAAMPGMALHSYYMQNGDAYVLICDGPYRATYALNNLSTGVVENLWNLKYTGLDQEAVGISAAQEWDGVSSQKRLYIFAGIDSGWTPHFGMISRRVICWPDPTGVYGTNRSDPSGAPPVIVHRYHNPGLPGHSPTGRGNHCASDYCRSLPNIFGGTCYPCSIIPAATPGKPGYYEVPAGKWYHSLDHPVWSPYTYRSYGGWVHYVCRENVEIKTRDLKLHQINRNSGVLNPTGYPQGVANVKTGERSTMDQRGECVDGCIRAVDGINLPGGELPIVDCVYSSIKKSYLYRREPTKTTYDLIGRDAGTTVVGDPADLTSRQIGVSSRDAAGDYLYVLGLNKVNQWLAAAGAPLMATFTDMAVSDQWWQTGGIVYAYDKSKKIVNKLRRIEAADIATDVEPIYVNIEGTLPDSIGADGLGHLYLMKTRKNPADPNAFKPANAYKYEHHWTAANGDKYCRAYFRQNVTKTVYKRHVSTKVIAPMKGEIPLGVNEYIRDFIVPSPFPISDLTKWSWNGAITLIGAEVSSAYRTELAVINSASPPEVTGDKDGLCDVRGPLLTNTAGDLYAAPKERDDDLTDGRDCYSDNPTYLFEVENYPMPDEHDVSLVGTVDHDGDGRMGQFCSTVQKISLKFYWKLVQIVKDTSGRPVEKVIWDYESAGAPSPYGLVFSPFSEGDYNLGCKVTFRYYDYDRMPPGSFFSDRAAFLTPPATMSPQIAKGEDGAGYSWVKFRVLGVADDPDPQGDAVIMSGLPYSGSFYYRPNKVTDPLSTYCRTATTTVPAGPRYVIPEQTSPTWSFQLRDNEKNRLADSTNRIKILMEAARPPIPPGTLRMVPDSNVWLGGASFTWTATLKRGTDTISDRTISTADPFLTAAQVGVLFPVPSQPYSYSLECKGTRGGQILIYRERRIPNPPFGDDIVWEGPFLRPIIVSLGGKCEVVVKDQTGPQAILTDPIAGKVVPGFFLNRNVLYGTTGETLLFTETPPVANADLVFVIADNNPMGNENPTGAILDYTDPFHHDPTGANGKGRIDLKVNHKYGNRFGQFVYDSDPGLASAGYPVERYRSHPNQTDNSGTVYGVHQKDLVQNDFGAGDLAWLPRSSYAKTFSYRMYKMPLDGIKNFDGQTATVPLSKANNNAGYMNYRYGFASKDAGEAPCSSVLLGSMLGSGEIVVRDNDRPCVFAQLTDLKREGITHTLPFNIKSEYWGTWKLMATGGTAEAIHNGIEDWKGSDIGGFDTGAGGPLVDTGAKVHTNVTSPLVEFEIDIPIFFHALMSDNLASPMIESYVLYDGDGTTPLYDNTARGLDMRYLFRVPSKTAGKYLLKIKVKDDARGWPTDFRRPFLTAPVQANYRNLECLIDVYSARLDVRVIDRTNRGQ